MPPFREFLGRLRRFPGNLGVSVAHDERRYARQASRELLELYQLVHREHPELSGRELYIAVIARRLGPNAGNAADIVLRADSLEGFDRVLARIRLIEGISQTETSLLLSTFKF